MVCCSPQWPQLTICYQEDRHSQRSGLCQWDIDEKHSHLLILNLIFSTYNNTCLFYKNFMRFKWDKYVKLFYMFYKVLLTYIMIPMSLLIILFYSNCFPRYSKRGYKMQTIIYRMKKQPGPTVEHRKLYSIPCDKS